MKKILIFLFLVILSSPLEVFASNIENGVTYQTYAEDYRRRLIPTQDAYISISSYTNFLGYTLNGPEDIFLDQMNQLYIADSLNSRILKISSNMDSVLEIGKDILKKPTGIYVDKNSFIYVADYDLSAVIKFDPNGVELKRFNCPTEPMFGGTTPYRPSKVIGDAGENLYIISEGTYQGMIQLNIDGEFLGFFGTNLAKFDLRTAIFKKIFPENIVANFIKTNPQTMINLTIDEQNRIYTVTRGTTEDAVKRLNVSGINKLPQNMNGTNVTSDIAVGPINNIYTIADDGFIREYDQEGNLLFMFGGKDSRIYQRGLFISPSAIDVDENYNIYVLDRSKNELQVFIPTNFATLVHNAVDLYQEGYYLESKEPWEEVLKVNSLFDLAHKGIGEAYFKMGKYEEALESYKLAGYLKGYSNAYWEIRNQWLMVNLSYLIIAITIIMIAYILLKYLFKISITGFVTPYLEKTVFKVPVLRELSYVNHVRKHPLDAIYGIKKENKASVFSATILYLLLFIEYVFAIFFEGSSFNNNELVNFSIVNELIRFIGPIFLFIISSYLISSINEGEGTIKNVYISTIYAFTPMLLFWPLIIILSRYLTLDESVIYEGLMFIIKGWTVILLIFTIKDIHNFSVGETFKVIFLTIFTMIMMIVTITLLSGLVSEIIQFIKEIISEVIIRD